jgi:predicted nucleotidyltransferase
MLLNREIILKFLKEHKEMFQSKYQIKKLGLFGSYAKGEENHQSDIDILVDMPSSFDLYYDLKEFLEEALNRSIDLGLEKSMRAFILDSIQEEIIYV